MKKFFEPKTIALIGATPRQGSVGRSLMENLLLYAKKQKNVKIIPVNPNRKKIFKKPAFPSVLDIKEKIDLAIIAVKKDIVLGIVKELAQKEVGGVIIISAGFGEIGKSGKILEEKILKIARKSKIPIIGPNCLGIIRPSIFLNASFAPTLPQNGEIALVSQSGALIDSIIDFSFSLNCGFSKIISTGNEIDKGIVDFLEYLKNDKETKVIALYVEGLKDGKKFLQTAKKVSLKKPIVVLKAGRSKTGQKAVSSHTGALAGNYQIYQAVFKKAGLIEAETIEELLNLAKILAWQNKSKNGVGIVTNGGGCGILMADYCEKLGIKIPPLEKKTIQKIEKSKVVPLHWSKRNPIDILGDDTPKRYQVAIKAILEQKNIYTLVCIQTLQAMTNSFENAKILVEAKKEFPQKAIISCFLGGPTIKKAVNFLEKHKIPNFSELKEAAIALRALIKNI